MTEQTDPGDTCGCGCQPDTARTAEQERDAARAWARRWKVVATRERQAFRQYRGWTRQDIRDILARAEAAERRVAELEAALRPFAWLARVTTQDPNRQGGGVVEWTWSAVHPDWVNRARAALRGAGEGE